MKNQQKKETSILSQMPESIKSVEFTGKITTKEKVYNFKSNCLLGIEDETMKVLDKINKETKKELMEIQEKKKNNN